MIDWIRTAQGIAAVVAPVFAPMAARWNLGLPRLVFSPELAPMHARIKALHASPLREIPIDRLALHSPARIAASLTGLPRMNNVHSNHS